MFEISFLEIGKGKAPFLTWEEKLDSANRGVVRIRLNRLRLGNFGDCKAIKGSKGIYELRIHTGSGYRIYFSKVGQKIIIILCAGDKSTQSKDIEKAKRYWELYKNLLS